MSSYIHRLEQQASALKDLQSRIFGRLKSAGTREEVQALLDEYFRAVSDCFAVAAVACDTKPENIDEVLAKADDILSDAINFALRGEQDSYGEDQPLFSQFPPFAHEGATRPLLEHKLPESYCSHWQSAELEELARMLGPERAKQLKGVYKLPRPWYKTSRPHTLSSRCARFTESVTEEVFAGVPARPLSILQGRFEMTYHGSTAAPGDVLVSRDGKGFILEMYAGYREREPWIQYQSFVEEDRRGSFNTGLERLTHSCFDHKRFMIAAGEVERVKVFTAAPPDYKGPGKILPLHTMATAGFSGAITFLPNNRIARSGQGELAIWDLGTLPTHGPEGNDIIGERLSTGDLYPDNEQMEMSSGTPPHTTQPLPWKEDRIGTWHPHPSNPTIMLCATERHISKQLYCHAIDLENGGKIAARYLGVGGYVIGFSTSSGDQNSFAVASSDGYVQLYDSRTPLPVMTIKTSPEDKQDTHPSAVLCHPDGIPLLFTAASGEECVKLWDLRHRLPLYEIATGNNNVEALAWNDSKDELYAITINTLHRMGDRDRYAYRAAKLPRSSNEPAEEEDDQEDNDAEADDDGQRDFNDYDDLQWPRRAYHAEDYWGHTFEQPYHAIFRYAFKESPDPTIVPEWNEY